MKQKIDYVHTINKGKLETLKGFNYFKGIGRYMGKAKDSKGKIWDIFTEPCDADCWCAAKAVEIV